MPGAVLETAGMNTIKRQLQLFTPRVWKGRHTHTHTRCSVMDAGSDAGKSGKLLSRVKKGFQEEDCLSGSPRTQPVLLRGSRLASYQVRGEPHGLKVGGGVRDP